MTETKAKALKFRRQHAGEYFAQDATHEYAIFRGRDWVLRIRATIETSGFRHALDQPNLYLGDHETKNLCVLIASAYSALGDDYQESEHGGRRRSTEAIRRGYAAERQAAGVFSSTERLEAARAGQYPDGMIPGDL